jgi:uncharacterized membrane protein YkoI
MTTAPKTRRTTAVRNTSAVLALTCAALLTGCGSDSDKDESSPSKSTSPSATGKNLTDDQQENKQEIKAATVGLGEAARTALAKKSGTELIDIDLEGKRDGNPVWEGTTASPDGSANEFRVDAVTGKATAFQADPDDDADDRKERADLLKQSTVRWEKALATAHQKHTGTPTSVELDADDGTPPAWSIDVVPVTDWYTTTVKISAVDGKIQSTHTDRD